MPFAVLLTQGVTCLPTKLPAWKEVMLKGHQLSRYLFRAFTMVKCVLYDLNQHIREIYVVILEYMFIYYPLQHTLCQLYIWTYK